ncbi:MAG: hypothetical protein WB441_00225 [Nocardioidaceae bacterium]
MEIAGLPLHALVIHAAVVFTPLAVLAAVTFAVLPRWRYLTRWPAVVLTVVALGSVWLARFSGNALVEERPELAPLVTDHQSRGNLLSLLMVLFTVVVLAAAWSLGGASGLVSGRGGRPSRVAALDTVLMVAVVLSAVLVLAWVFLTGDAGSRAVWG